jgi:hypothetical protein
VGVLWKEFVLVPDDFLRENAITVVISDRNNRNNRSDRSDRSDRSHRSHPII